MNAFYTGFCFIHHLITAPREQHRLHARSTRLVHPFPGLFCRSEQFAHRNIKPALDVYRFHVAVAFRHARLLVVVTKQCTGAYLFS